MSQYDDSKRFVFAGLVLTIWILLGTYDSAWPVIIRMATFEKINAVYPFTFAEILVTVAVSYLYTRSFLTSFTLPFAFLGLYEIAWHSIPGSGPFPNLFGIIYIMSWLLVGCVSIRRWKLDTLVSLTITAEVVLFAAWFAVGFVSEYSFALNVITKMLMAAVFIEVTRAGTKKSVGNAKKPLCIQMIKSRMFSK